MPRNPNEQQLQVVAQLLGAASGLTSGGIRATFENSPRNIQSVFATIGCTRFFAVGGCNRSTAGEYIDDVGLPSGCGAPVYEVSPGRFTIDRDT